MLHFFFNEISINFSIIFHSYRIYIYTLKYVGDSELYLVAFDKYMDTLYKPTDEPDLSHKPLEKNLNDFIEMITKVNIEEYINSLNFTSSDNTETPTSNS